ncbi:MAG: hypothetical protein HYR63_01755 [Proteobacteria bacterium]|nr:hypothetical protein [Pseudomonadota bacterium]
MALKPKFSAVRFAQRLLISLALVFSTYNPTGYSISHWLLGRDNGLLSAKLVVLLAALIVYFAVSRIVFGAFRWSGLIPASVLAVLVSIVIVAPAFHGDLDSASARYWVMTQYVLLTASVLVMAFGMSWSYLIERLTGQLQKRYVQ